MEVAAPADDGASLFSARLWRKPAAIAITSVSPAGGVASP
jgi:hypothetical protein